MNDDRLKKEVLELREQVFKLQQDIRRQKEYLLTANHLQCLECQILMDEGFGLRIKCCGNTLNYCIECFYLDKPKNLNLSHTKCSNCSNCLCIKCWSLNQELCDDCK